MQYIKGFFSLLWRGWFVLLATISTIFVGAFIIYPLTFLPNAQIWVHRFMRVWAMIIFYGSGVWYKLHHPLKLNPQQQYMIVSNHTSMMDIMLMYLLIKQPMVFVGKAELAKMPIFGRIYARTNVLVDRKNPNSRMAVFKKVSQKLAQGYSVCIFPEGGVPDAEITLDRFLDGPFAMAVLHKLPMVVFTFCGLKQILPYAYFKGRPGKVDVFLNKIIPAETYGKKEIPEFKEQVRKSILDQITTCEN